MVKITTQKNLESTIAKTTQEEGRDSMLRPLLRDFRVTVRRHLYDQQGEVIFTESEGYYVHGAGDDVKNVIVDAQERTRMFCERFEWDEAKLRPTLGDSYRATRHEPDAYTTYNEEDEANEDSETQNHEG